VVGINIRRCGSALVLGILLAVGATVIPDVVLARPGGGRETPLAGSAAQRKTALSLDPAELASPAVSDIGPTEMFFVDPADGTLYQQYRPIGGSWTRPLKLEGAVGSQPTVVANSSGLHLLVRKADGG
jgi:hypothetical protein